MYRQDMDDTISKDPPVNYERFFVPAIGAPVADDLLDAAALQPGQRVLDVACGTGVIARRAAEAVGLEGAVTALDLNPGMLAVARELPHEGPTIDWQEGNAENLPSPDASFDVVLCQMGLQFVADKPAALREMQRVLRPGGRLVINLPGPMAPVFRAMDQAIGDHMGAEAAGFVKAVFSLHDPKEIRTLLEQAGFGDVDVQADTKRLRLPAPEQFLWQYVYSTPLAGVIGQVDQDAKTAMERDVVAKWQPFVEDGGMVMDQQMVLAMGRK